MIIEHSEWVRLRLSKAETPHSTTIAAGAHVVLLSLAVAALATSMMIFHRFSWRVQNLTLGETFSAIALATLGAHWHRISDDAVRVLADAALLTPAAILPFLHR